MSLLMQLFRRMLGLFWSGRIQHYLCWSSLCAYFHGGHTLCSRSYLATQGVEMVLEKWAVGGITQGENTNRRSAREQTFEKENILAVVLLSEKPVFQLCLSPYSLIKYHGHFRIYISQLHIGPLNN